MQDIFDHRGMIQMGTVRSVDDTGQVQTVVVQADEGGSLYTAEVVQMFGIASVPPVNGCIAMLFAVGGDPANMKAILLNPSKRYGNQQQGETVIYSAGGSRVAIRQGGSIDVFGATVINVTAPSVVITATGDVSITSGGSIALTGNLTVDGNIHATGTISP